MTRLVEIYASVVTGFENVAKNEVESVLSCSSGIDRGQVRFDIDVDTSFRILTLRSVDNVYAVGYNCEIDGLSQLGQEEALEVLKQQIPSINWALMIEIWQMCHGRELYGGVSEIKASMKEFVENGCYQKSTDKSPKFRVTGHRSGEKKDHAFSSMDVARSIGAMLNNIFGWKPDMKNYDLEVVLQIKKNTVLVMVALNKDSLFKRNVCAFGPTTLRSTICYSLLALAQPKTGDVIVDTMCGGGSIPLEGSLAFPQSFFIGGDNHSVALERCVENTKYCPASSSRLNFLQWNALDLPIRSDSVDAIVTDLPFGKKIGSTTDNRLVYPKLLKEWARVVRHEGHLVAMTHDERSWDKALHVNKDSWKVLSSRKVNVGGLFVLCQLLTNVKNK